MSTDVKVTVKYLSKFNYGEALDAELRRLGLEEAIKPGNKKKDIIDNAVKLHEKIQLLILNPIDDVVYTELDGEALAKAKADEEKKAQDENIAKEKLAAQGQEESEAKKAKEEADAEATKQKAKEALELLTRDNENESDAELVGKEKDKEQLRKIYETLENVHIIKALRSIEISLRNNIAGQRPVLLLKKEVLQEFIED